MAMYIDSTDITWYTPNDCLISTSYNCAHCGNIVSSHIGYKVEASCRNREGSLLRKNGAIYICPHCKNPTLIFDGRQYPGIPEVKPVKHLPTAIQEVYEEARTCMSHCCFTAAVMICRKIIMNVAVENGAEENMKFIQYVDFIDKEGLFPKKCRPALDRIKNKGNEANHEIEQITKEDASLVMSMAYQMLVYIYEMPAALDQ